MSFDRLSHLAKTYERQDAILAPTGPVALVLQLLLWAACLVLRVCSHSRRGGLLLLRRFAPVTHGPLHSGGRARRRSGRLGGRHFRRCDLGRHRCPADRLPAGALQLVQPTRGSRFSPGESGRRPGVGSRAPGAPPVGRNLRHASGPVRRVGGMGGRRRRNPHHLPCTASLSVSRAVVLVAPRTPRRSRRRRHASGARTQPSVFPGPSVPSHGIHIAQPDRNHTRVGGGP